MIRVGGINRRQGFEKTNSLYTYKKLAKKKLIYYRKKIENENIVEMTP